MRLDLRVRASAIDTSVRTRLSKVWYPGWLRIVRSWRVKTWRGAPAGGMAKAGAWKMSSSASSRELTAAARTESGRAPKRAFEGFPASDTVVEIKENDFVPRSVADQSVDELPGIRRDAPPSVQHSAGINPDLHASVPTISGTLAARALEVLEHGFAGRSRQPSVGYRRRHIRLTSFEAPRSQPPLQIPFQRENGGEGHNGRHE